MADTIYRADAITAIKGLYNVLGVAGTKAAVMVLEGIPTATDTPQTDYANKCGTCKHFEQCIPWKHGWCHKQPYPNNHVYPFKRVNMCRAKCRFYVPKEE